MKIFKIFLLLFLFNNYFYIFSQELQEDDLIEEIDDQDENQELEEETEEEQESKDTFDDLELEEDFLNIEPEEEDNKNIENKKEVEKESQKKCLEFKQNLEKYYPKIFLICEKFFYFMTPQDLAKNLQEITNMIAHKPYLYFEFLFKQIEKKLTEQEKIEWKKNNFNIETLKSVFNNKTLNKWIKNGGGYYELIANQLAYYNYFIEYCYVDLKDNSVDVYSPNDYDFYFLYSAEKKDSTKIKLRDYWVKNGVLSFYDFYELSFVYWSKLFLNAILEKNCEKATNYFFDLKVITDKLIGSDYYQTRRENLKTYEQLFDILKQEIKIKLDKPASDDNKYMQEFQELWDF